jgi:hypothetical protein
MTNSLGSLDKDRPVPSDHVASPADEVAEDAQPPHNLRYFFLAVVKRELPYFAMLSLAILGVGYVSFTGQPTDFIWISLVPVFGAMCVFAGWSHVQGREGHWRLIWTQALHWLSFFVVMNLVYLPEVRSVANNNAAGLNVMTILALATFVAGIHAQAWQICGVGLILAFAVPLVAWIEQSALFSLVVVVGIAIVAGSLWLAIHREKRRVSQQA